MRKIEDALNRAVLGLFTLLTGLLAFLIFFIFRESIPAIRDEGLKILLLGCRIADDCIFMLNGQRWGQNTTEELFGNPQKQETKDYLQGAYA